MDIICSNNLYLTDTRNITVFKNKLIGGYDKADVLKHLNTKLTEGQIESSCYLAYQLLSSGHLKVLWDKLLSFIYKNVRNAKIIKWIYHKNNYLTKLTQSVKTADYLHLRNSQLVRNLITEVIITICQNKITKIETLKKKFNNRDFEVERFNKLIQHKGKLIIGSISGPNDTNEIILAGNELAHNLVNKNIQESFYWIEWLLNWEKVNVKKYKIFEVQSRTISGVEPKYQRNLIWFIWCVILYVKELLESKLKVFYGEQNYPKLIETLDFIWLSYLYDWKPSTKNKKQVLILLYINYLLNPQDLTIKLVPDTSTFMKISIIAQEKLFSKIKEQCIVDPQRIYLNKF